MASQKALSNFKTLQIFDGEGKSIGHVGCETGGLIGTGISGWTVSNDHGKTYTFDRDLEVS